MGGPDTRLTPNRNCALSMCGSKTTAIWSRPDLTKSAEQRFYRHHTDACEACCDEDAVANALATTDANDCGDAAAGTSSSTVIARFLQATTPPTQYSAAR